MKLHKLVLTRKRAPLAAALILALNALLYLGVILVLAGCMKPRTGPPGANGEPGRDGQDGEIIRVVLEPAPTPSPSPTPTPDEQLRECEERVEEVWDIAADISFHSLRLADRIEELEKQIEQLEKELEREKKDKKH